MRAVCSWVSLTTTHQVDKSHLHPPCQLRGGGGGGGGAIISIVKDISQTDTDTQDRLCLFGMMLKLFYNTSVKEQKKNLPLVY